MQIFTHETESWKVRNKFINGAGTYSKDIVDSQINNFVNVFKDKQIIISTCPLICDLWDSELIYDNPELIIQYLHTFPYDNPIDRIKSIVARSKYKDVSKWIFITAYKPYEELMLIHNINVVYIPMMINTSLTPKGTNEIERAVWFGNIYDNKIKMFNLIRDEFKKSNIKLTVITKGEVNSKRKINQQEAFNFIKHYQYGIGVGRCALEMYNMGLKVIIAGAEFGGICMNENHVKIQEELNFNGRVITWNRSIKDCINVLPHSYTPKIKNINEINHVDLIINRLIQLTCNK